MEDGNCPKCGRHFDEVYVIHHDQPYVATPYEMMAALETYSAYWVEKQTICLTKHFLHFRFVESGEERLVELAGAFDWDKIAELHAGQEAHPQQCDEEGCTNEGTPCYVHSYDEQPTDYYCDEHIAKAGYCRGCHLFYAGSESFDFSPIPGYCEGCVEAIRSEEDDESDDEEEGWGWWDYPREPDILADEKTTNKYIGPGSEIE